MRSISSLREVVARGGTCLAAEGREAIVAFVCSRQCSDGGFAGKSSSSDLYYTVFAAATLDALGSRWPLLKLPRYLKTFGDGVGLDFVHLVCLAQLIGAFPGRRRLENVLARLEAYRSCDGGYHHAVPGAERGTGYAMHLAIEAYAGAHREPPHSGRIRDALETLFVSGDGDVKAFADLSGQTNTIAAVCIARIRLGLEPETSSSSFLMDQYNAVSGGFCAYPQARTPDLLSTASALYTLNVLGIPLETLAPRCRAFVESLWTDEGGFCGAPGDPIPDCEYTFYALLALGALL